MTAATQLNLAGLANTALRRSLSLLYAREMRFNLMPDIEFSVSGEREGEKLYALRINGKLIEDGLTIDEVIRRINRNDMECLGERHCQTPEDLRPRHSRR